MMRTDLLSPREIEVLLRMAQGLTNQNIANELRLSIDTVKTHARRIYMKLNANDRAHAVARGYQRGYLVTGGVIG